MLVFFGTSKAFTLLVSFASFGFILSYYMPIVAWPTGSGRNITYRQRGGSGGSAW